MKSKKKTSTAKKKYPSKNDVFDLNKIPMEVLDRAWQPYRPYLEKLDPDSPLAKFWNSDETDKLEETDFI